MNVKKCDRCGEIFNRSVQPRVFNFTKNQNVNQIYTLNEYGERLDTFDLCNECIKDFNEWMKGEENE